MKNISYKSKINVIFKIIKADKYKPSITSQKLNNIAGNGHGKKGITNFVCENNPKLLPKINDKNN